MIKLEPRGFLSYGVSKKRTYTTKQDQSIITYGGKGT
jgi:hypothetical protein